MPRIDVKDAVKAARDYLNVLYDKAADVRLEEVELDGDAPATWHVTLSFTTPSIDLPIGHSALTRMLEPLAPTQFPRYYKLFIIDAHTGEPRAMKIRTV